MSKQSVERGGRLQTQAGLDGRIWAVAVGGLALVVIAVLIYLQSRPLPPPKVSGYVPVTHDGGPKYLVGTDGARLYLNESHSREFQSRAGIQLRGRGGARRSSDSDHGAACGFSRRGNLLVADEVGQTAVQRTALGSACAWRVTP